MRNRTVEPELFSAREAAAKLGLSHLFLYRLPTDTPGIHVFGRLKRFDVTALRKWAREKANCAEV